MSREIDWSSAQVKDATLKVAVAGESPRGWNGYVSSVLDRLQRGTGRWGEIEVKRGRISVESVTPGAESDLRHLLESAVLQANAHFGLDEEGDDGDDDDGDDKDEATDADRQMTDAFRAFASR